MTTFLGDSKTTPSKPCDDGMQYGDGGIWVFAYGSLIWRPDFQPVESRVARLAGWRRSLCILSTVYRGTPEAPGLVLGLDRGGSCLGRALRVASGDWPEVKARLDAREMITGVYNPRFLRVRLEDGARVLAYAYVANRHHRQYWSGTEEQAVRLLRQGAGTAGSARDYLANTVAQLAVLGIADRGLRRMLGQVDAKIGI